MPELTIPRKNMTISEAKSVLMRLAEGKYHSMKYEISDHGRGNFIQHCQVYLPDHGWFEGAHWDAALQQLADKVNGRAALSEELPLSSKSDLAAIGN